MRTSNREDAITEPEELLEAMLDADPLGMRLAQAQVTPMSVGFWTTVLAKHHGARHRHRSHRRFLFGAAGLVVALSLMAVTPVGATVGRVLLPEGLQQRFGIVVGAPYQLPPGGQAPGHGRGHAPAAGPTGSQGVRGGGDFVRPHLSLAEAQSKVHFRIPTPRWLPGGLNFRGALAFSGDALVPNGDSVFLSYGDASGQKGLGLWIYSVTPVGGSAVPSSSAQLVEVTGGVAYYVHGSYEDAGPGTEPRWNPAADDAELTWQHNGMTFDLTAGGLHPSRDDLIRIAESLR